jgi:hypothetical protein
MILFKLLLFILFSFSQDAPDITSGELVAPSEPSQQSLSPFYSCSSLKSYKGPVKTSWLSTRVPEQDQSGNKTRDFFKELQKRIEVQAQQNLDTSRQVVECFHRPSQVSETPDCAKSRTWLDPKKYPSSTMPEKENTLVYNIKMARANLALADPNVDFFKSMAPNTQLKPYGYKEVPWEPLRPEEKTAAQKVLNDYKEQYKKKHNVTEDEFNDLIKQPYDRNSDNQIYANPMNISDADMQDRLKRSKRRELEHFFQKPRTQYLENYRAILARYPIINYLTSANPSALEMHTAGLRLQENAKKEMAEIKSVGKLLATPTHRPRHPLAPDPSINNASILNLLDYRNIAEDLLAEHPEYCAVASTAELQREKREFRKSLFVAAPLLAVCFIAPPMAIAAGASAVTAGAATAAISAVGGGAIAYSSYLDMVDQRQGAYSAPVVAQPRSTQSSVDEAQDVFKMDVMMIPLQIIP